MFTHHDRPHQRADSEVHEHALVGRKQERLLRRIKQAIHVDAASIGIADIGDMVPLPVVDSDFTGQIVGIEVDEVVVSRNSIGIERDRDVPDREACKQVPAAVDTQIVVEIIDGRLAHVALGNHGTGRCRAHPGVQRPGVLQLIDIHPIVAKRGGILLHQTSTANAQEASIANIGPEEERAVTEATDILVGPCLFPQAHLTHGSDIGA